MTPARRYAPINLNTRLSRIAFANPVHQNVVVDVVKEFGDVHVHHPVLATLDVLLRCPDRIVCAPSRSESVAVLAEVGLEDRLQHLQKHLLYPSIQHRRYPQHPGSSVGFGYLHSPHWTGHIRPCQQLCADAFPMRSNVVAQLPCRHSVNARRASVAFDRQPGRRGIVLRDDFFHQFFVHCFLSWVARDSEALPSRSPCSQRLHRLGLGLPVPSRGRSCRARLFRGTFRPQSLSFPLSFALSFFGPSLFPIFVGLLRYYGLC